MRRFKRRVELAEKRAPRNRPIVFVGEGWKSQPTQIRENMVLGENYFKSSDDIPADWQNVVILPQLVWVEPNKEPATVPK